MIGGVSREARLLQMVCTASQQAVQQLQLDGVELRAAAGQLQLPSRYRQMSNKQILALLASEEYRQTPSAKPHLVRVAMTSFVAGCTRRCVMRVLGPQRGGKTTLLKALQRGVDSVASWKEGAVRGYQWTRHT